MLLFPDILNCGLAALDSGKPVMGIKGVSMLHGMEWFDLVWGIVPDYMHGVLLGITKMMLKLWFSSSYADKPYFLGRCIKHVDKSLKKMKPTDDISRLPRKIENNIHHYKASELQMWLLFYAVPCLIDIMPSEYMNHFSLLVEGIYILLGDNITTEQLDNAENILARYYADFAELYGRNNCTLNLHNIGQHLSLYVRKLGPLWAWSCFAFEDMNGTILESVHGTGKVCYQILWAMQAKKRLSVDCIHMKDPALREFVQHAMNTRREVKIKHEAINCKIAGGMSTTVLNDDMIKKVKQILGISDQDCIGNVSKVGRIILYDKVFFSKYYTRMIKRIGNIVLLHNDDNEYSLDSVIASVQYFLLHHNSNKCVAVVKNMKMNEHMALIHGSVSHLIAVQPENDDSEEQVILVEDIQEKLLYLNGNTKRPCVARLPNFHGQSS